MTDPSANDVGGSASQSGSASFSRRLFLGSIFVVTNLAVFLIARRRSPIRRRLLELTVQGPMPSDGRLAFVKPPDDGVSLGDIRIQFRGRRGVQVSTSFSFIGSVALDTLKWLTIELRDSTGKIIGRKTEQCSDARNTAGTLVRAGSTVVQASRVNYQTLVIPLEDDSMRQAIAAVTLIFEEGSI